MTMKKLFAAILFSAAFAASAAPFAGACDGVTDDTPALNAQIASALSGRDKEIVFPGATCVFMSQPNQISGGVSLIGQGKSTTVLRRAFSGNMFRIIGQGTTIKGLTIYADAGTSGGIGIEMVASEALGAGGNHTIEGVWITGNGTWVVPLGAWGQDKTTAPVGIRTITLRDVSVFNATWQAMTLWGCVSCEWFGGGAYQGFGTTQMIVVGGPNSQKNRIDANIDWAASTIYSGSMRGYGM